MEFTKDEKIALFDKIEQLYFKKNFGSTSKADLEVLLFSAYIEHCIDAGEQYDDYTLSKELGITQTRIRTLKEKKELKYPRENFKWEEAFAQAVVNAKLDENDRYVKMIIQDVNVMNEIRHYIEQKGWYDECSLNKKLLRIPLSCFVEICAKDSQFDEAFSLETKKNIMKLRIEDSAVATFLDDFTKEGLKNCLMSVTRKTACEVLKEIKIPGNGFANVAFQFLIKAIEEG